MKIGFGYARRADAVTLVRRSSLTSTGPLHLRNEMISTAAHADEIRKIRNAIGTACRRRPRSAARAGSSQILRGPYFRVRPCVLVRSGLHRFLTQTCQPTSNSSTRGS